MKIPSRYPNLNYHSLSVNHFQTKIIFHEKRKAVSLAGSQSHKLCLSSPCALLHSRNPFCILILSQGIFLKEFKGQELINNFSTVSSRTSLRETDFIVIVHCKCVLVNTTASTVWWHCLDVCQGSTIFTLCCFSTVSLNATL